MKIFSFFLLLILTGTLHAETLSLQSGWNLVGVNSSLSLEEIKKKIGIENLLLIQGKNKTYQKAYIDEDKGFLNSFQTLEEGRGYWIKVNTAVDIEYEKITYATDRTINLIAGWNLINPPTDLNISETLSQLGDNLKVIQGISKSYKKANIDNDESFLNRFQNFEEPMGYWIKVATASTLNFPFINIKLSITKPILTITPTSTTADTQSVEINGEVGLSVWVNGVNKGIIDSTGKLTIVLDTSGTDGTKTFSIILKDASNNSSDVLLLNIKKIIEPILAVSDETYYKYLWHIDSKNSSEQKIVEEVSSVTGSESLEDNIDPNADINILEAWKITKGKGVKVAVIDDGGDVNHEDLKANIFLAYNVDGKSNDIYHYSDSITDASHGNNCAGFIAAPINGKGIVGVAPESKLILIRQEEEADSAAIEAFEYAKDNGAKVISCSWGTGAVSEAIVAELKSLYDAGITVVFASGNEGSDLDEEGVDDESEVPWVIGVGASSELNDVALYSNYGRNIDIIAPGGNHSTSVGILALDDSGEQGATKNYGLVSNDYAFTDGTSFSTPIVAGVVALMYSVNPDITPKEVRDILISTADKVGGDKADYWDGFDLQRAYGKINALKAVEKAQQ